jgi:hypothetical protein
MLKSGYHVLLDDGTIWPRLGGQPAEDLIDTLLYGRPTPVQLCAAASIASAYRALVSMPRRRRAEVIAALREAEQ